MPTLPSLSLVIPAYNESARLGDTLRQVFDYFNAQSAPAEVIVVDDGSGDDTPSVAEESFARHAGATATRVIRVEPNRGKGHAVRTGLLAARAPIALFSDADLSTPISETPKVTGPIRSGQYDLIFGSRALDRTLIGVHQPWRREQGGRFFNLVVRLATGMPFWDTQCGFKAFRMDVCRPIIEAATIDRFGFDVELLYVARLAGLRLREWPVRWDHNEGGKVEYTRDSMRMLNEVRLIRAQAQRGVYERALNESRALRARLGDYAPVLDEGMLPPLSDVSPELAKSRF